MGKKKPRWMSKIALSKTLFSSPRRFSGMVSQTVLPFKLDTTPGHDHGASRVDLVG
jgi:hypothetical protein